jgi:hypothetical protein
MPHRDTESTWTTLPSLLPRDPSLAGRRLRIDRPVSVLGRDPSSDIVVSQMGTWYPIPFIVQSGLRAVPRR